jgi:hypothetical protein
MAAITDSDFDAGGEFLARAITGAVNLRASHTIAVRVKSSRTTTTYNSVVGSYVSTSDQSGSYFGRSNGATSTAMNAYRINFFGTPSGNAARSTCYGNTTTWYHLTFVYNTTNIRFYIDGVYIGQAASGTTAASSSTSNTFGCALHPGKSADFAFYNRALTDGEVADLAAYRVPQVTSGLVAFCRLDSSGVDTSGNGNDLSVTGSGTALTWSTADNPPQPETPTLAIAGDAASTSAFAGALTNFRLLAGAAASSSAFAGSLNTTKPIAGSAASSSALTGQLRALLSGSASSTSALSAALSNQQQIAGSAASSSALGAWLRPRWGRRVENGSGILTRSATMLSAAAGWTFCAWIRPISIGTDTHNALLDLYTAGSAGPRIGVRRTSGTLRTYILANDDSTLVINHQSANDGNWHHIGVTYDGVTLRGFVDGSQVASGAATITGNFNFLSLSASASSVAEYAHVKLWSKALTGTELTSEATYYTPHVANAQLYAWWQLAWNNVTLDSSGNGQTLTDASSTEAQTESPGAPLQLLAGSAASSSALAGTLNTTKPLFGNAVSQSVFQGTVTVSVPLAGSTASSSTFSASLTALLTGNASSSSSFAASLTTLKPIAGDAASSSALAGALTALLTGAANSSSAFAAALGQALGVTGPLASSSALSGILGIQGAFGGVLQSSSALAATMFVQKPVAGDAASSSALSAAMVQDYAIASALASASALGGALTVQLDIQGSLTSTSALGGTLTVPFEIQGAMASVSALSATLGTAITISGALASGSAFSASLTAQIAGNAASASALSAQLSLLNTLVGNAASSSVLTGNMTVLSQRALAANAASSSQLIGALRVTVPAAASGNVVTSGSAKALYGPSDIPSGRLPRRWPPRY